MLTAFNTCLGRQRQHQAQAQLCRRPAPWRCAPAHRPVHVNSSLPEQAAASMLGGVGTARPSGASRSSGWQGSLSMAPGMQSCCLTLSQRLPALHCCCGTTHPCSAGPGSPSVRQCRISVCCSRASTPISVPHHLRRHAQAGSGVRRAHM